MKTKIYLLATTKLQPGWGDFLEKFNITKWVSPGNSDGDLLVETAGRLCYRSWEPYDPTKSDVLNQNVTRTRYGNKAYIGNLIESGHGSVLEHVNFTFLLHGISRVLTHELVRHRAGCSYSQESLRYCRLDRLEIVIPEGELDSLLAKEIIDHTVNTIRFSVAKLNKLLLDNAPDFATKKRITSLIRRIAPIGIRTSIIFTANARALRHIIQQRTTEHAEVEIRRVFKEILEICKKETPNLFQDL